MRRQLLLVRRTENIKQPLDRLLQSTPSSSPLLLGDIPVVQPLPKHSVCLRNQSRKRLTTFGARSSKFSIIFPNHFFIHFSPILFIERFKKNLVNLRQKIVQLLKITSSLIYRSLWRRRRKKKEKKRKRAGRIARPWSGKSQANKKPIFQSVHCVLCNSVVQQSIQMTPPPLHPLLLSLSLSLPTGRERREEHPGRINREKPFSISSTGARVIRRGLLIRQHLIIVSPEKRESQRGEETFASR